MSEVQTKSKGRLRWVLLLVLIVVLVGIAVKFLLYPTPFVYAGTLEATKVDLSAQLPSLIASVKVDEGDHVSEGELLVALSCDDFLLSAKLAKQNFERVEKLVKSGSATVENLDQLKNAKEQAELKVKWCSLVSPISGTVLSRYHEPGEWASPGLKLLTLANVRDIWTFIYVPEPEVSKLKVGAKVKGLVPELPTQEFEGTIVKINAEAEFTPKNVQTQSERTRLVYGVKVSFLGANEQEVLKPGMTIEVRLPKD